jgi:hypothetical protein
MREWEYRIIVIPKETKAIDAEASLCSMGICRWELVTVQGDSYIFKRPR